MNIIGQKPTLGFVPAKNIVERMQLILSKEGIRDVQFMYDPYIKPFGMWAVVQVTGVSSNLILPSKYNEQKPYILWWCKDSAGRYRDPSEEDLHNIIVVVRRAPKIWADPQLRADKFDAIDAEKDRKHNEKLKSKIHEIAPAMKRAISKGNL